MNLIECMSLSKNLISYQADGKHHEINLTHLSYTNIAMSQVAKDSLSESSFLTLSSGISRRTRNFLLPCQKRDYVTFKQVKKYFFHLHFFLFIFFLLFLGGQGHSRWRGHFVYNRVDLKCEQIYANAHSHL